MSCSKTTDKTKAMVRIEKTLDGTDTIFSDKIGETFHSIKGALSESEHIFIKNGLAHCNKANINVLEIGFGTGLNALCSLSWAINNNKKIFFSTIELFPLKEEIYSKLNYCDTIGYKAEFRAIHQIEWDKATEINQHFSIQKLKQDFHTITELPDFDVCFFDAFSPERQPEMWTEERFYLLYKSARKGAILTTYCSKGEVRRRMQRAGFCVERLEGPIGGKREILRATKL